MKIAIVHLSDIHFRNNEEGIILNGRIDKLAGAIRGQAVGIKHLLILVTGDIAFSGAQAEYKLAKTFFKELLAKISIDGEKKFHLVMIPGNHDCDFSGDQTERDKIIRLIVGGQSSISEYCDDCMKIQSAFFQFRKEVENSSSSEELVSPKVFEVVTFVIESKQIVCNLLNTSWISQISEKQGELFFPVDLIVSPQSRDRPDDLVITLLHHPYVWFQPENSRKLRNKLDSISDIILTGHEHESDVYEKIKRSGDTTEYIEGGVLQDSSPDISEFNFLIVDFETKKQEIHTYRWSKAPKMYESDEKPLVSDLTCNQNRPNIGRQLKEDFEKELNDIGMKFSHPAIENIALDDVFVFPHFRKLITPVHQQLAGAIIPGEIADFINENKYVLIFGAERCGKTVFSKKLFKVYVENGLCPLLLDGVSIRGPEENRIESLIKRQVEVQYKKPDINEFSQLEKQKKVLIVDDFQKANLNAKGREKVIATFKERFEIIVIIGNEELRLDDLFLSPEDSIVTSDFIGCEIMQFGHVKRAELIKKWYLLGQGEFLAQENELSHNIVRAEKIISSILGRNFVPPYPLFILAILQQLEVGISVNTTSGSIGYLYESLLTLALARTGGRGRELDTYYSYLSELAYFFFSERIKRVSERKLNNWHEEYCNKYQLSLEKEKILGTFMGASILKREYDGMSFRYPYIYYYFVGRYFRDHITEDIIRDNIKMMSERLHQTEAANIIVFLCYLSKDPYILNTLLSAAQKLFAHYSEFDVISDSAFVANLLSELPRLLLNADNPNENQENELKKKDEIEQNEEDVVEEELVLQSKSDFDLEEFAQINVAAKSIQILGQLLKNFPGSWQGHQKLALVRQCYSLGLRVLSFIFSDARECQEEVVQRVAEILKAQNPDWEDQKIYNGVYAFVFSLLEGFSYWFIKHIADSVGHIDFTITYNDLLERYPDNLSYQFIDVTIHLDFYSDFPKFQIFELAKKIHKNNFAMFLLRHSVWHYFYIYKANRDLCQSVCDKLDIQLTTKKRQHAKYYSHRKKRTSRGMF